MTGTHSGGCLCGASRFAFEGAPKFAIQCFCRDCQHVSGGGHLPQMAVDRAVLAAMIEPLTGDADVKRGLLDLVTAIFG